MFREVVHIKKRARRRQEEKKEAMEFEESQVVDKWSERNVVFSIRFAEK